MQQSHTETNDLPDFPCFIYTKDLDGSFLASNDYMAQKAGFTKGSELLGMTDFDLCWKNDADRFRLNDQQVIAQKDTLVLIEDGTLIDNQFTTTLSFKMPVYSRNKKVIGISGISILIDKNKRIPDLLSKLNFRAIISNSDSLSYRTPLKSMYDLTNRQADCLHYLARGLTAKETADTLGLSKRTVEHYLHDIKVKLDCNSRSALISKLLQAE